MPLWRLLRAEAVERSWWLRFALPGSVPERWRHDAECVGLTDLFYARGSEDLAAACEACRSCPVRRVCLQEGFDVERTIPLFDIEWSGVLGGFTPAERLAYWKAHPELRDIQPARAVCGTDAGYRHHRKHREDACAECKAAHAADNTDRNRRHRARAVAQQQAHLVGLARVLVGADR